MTLESLKRNQTVSRLEQGSASLKNAISLLENGSLKSLLEYYETGYVRKNFHLPSVLLAQENWVGEQLCTMINERLNALNVHVSLDPNSSTTSFVMHYKSKKWGKLGVLDPHERILWFEYSFKEKAIDLEHKFDRLQAKRFEIESQYNDLKDYLDRINRGFRKVKRSKEKELLLKMKNSIPAKIEETEMTLKELRYERKIWKELKTVLPLLKRELQEMGVRVEMA